MGHAVRDDASAEGEVTAGRTVNSSSRDWCTPQKYVTAVRHVLGEIALDPCSNEHSIVAARVEYRMPTDGLVETWNFPRIYVNPPYGSDRERGTTIRHWLRRCADAGAQGSEVLALIPVATNTRHWKEYVFGAAAGVAFLADTRLRFLVAGQDVGKGAPMACAMVYWGGYYDRFREVFAKHGAVVRLR